MNNRTFIVREPADEGASSSALIFGIVAVIAILVIGLFVWQPWNDTTTTNTTVTTQGQDSGAGASSSSTTTTTTSGSTTTSTNP